VVQFRKHLTQENATGLHLQKQIQSNLLFYSCLVVATFQQSPMCFFLRNLTFSTWIIHLHGAESFSESNSHSANEEILRH